MLHASNSKNVRRVLVMRTAEHRNEKNEDAITSMVFTPLAFMTATEAARCLTLMFGVEFQRLCGRALVRHKGELWPRDLKAPYERGGPNTRCEPDVVIRFELCDGEHLTFIGEMKWDSGDTEGEIDHQLERESRWRSKCAVAAEAIDSWPSSRSAG
jgi:hypothetical protein